VGNGLYRLGCDIGGTFTDFVLVNDQTGAFEINKCLTTPGDPSEAVETGIQELKSRNPQAIEGLTEIVHGTTLVINAIIERKGAVTGLITTKGFRDVLELGREIRYDAYDIFAEYPEPLVPRYLRREVDERIASDGRVLTPLDDDDRAGCACGSCGPRGSSLAVCLINSYENPAHEKAIADIVRREAPGSFSVDLFRGAAPDPGIRAHLHHRHQCLRQAHHRALSEKASGPPGWAWLSTAGSSSCSLRAASPVWTRPAATRCASSNRDPRRR
jgi:N-methylhydantoinase A/oxoprolinase/acetone carboxylase beta subunit